MIPVPHVLVKLFIFSYLAWLHIMIIDTGIAFRKSALPGANGYEKVQSSCKDLSSRQIRILVR